jgi:hypothetical protein
MHHDERIQSASPHSNHTHQVIVSFPCFQNTNVYSSDRCGRGSSIPKHKPKKTNHTQEPNAVGMPNKDCAEKWALTADVH